MLLKQWQKSAMAVTLSMALGFVGLLPAQEVQVPDEPTGDAGLFGYIGGIAKAKRARTQTAPTVFNESAGWVNLPNATLSYVVPTNQSELFNVAFSAECRLLGSVPPNDYLRIRVLDNGVPMEPYDGFQAFCSANGYATHAGMWAKRVGPGNHVLQVQFWILDGVPFGALQAIIDDWTFEVVVYE
jgi:hypothetical protein